MLLSQAMKNVNSHLSVKTGLAAFFTNQKEDNHRHFKGIVTCSSKVVRYNVISSSIENVGDLKLMPLNLKWSFKIPGNIYVWYAVGWGYVTCSDISALCSAVPCNHALVFHKMTSESAHFCSTGLPGNAIRDLSKCIIFKE